MNILLCCSCKKSTRFTIFLGLLIASFVYWQSRFVRVSSNLLPSNACHSSEVWLGTNDSPWVNFSAEGVTVIKEKNGPVQAIQYPLGDLTNARYLSVKCDAAWENCVGDPLIMWSIPRISVTGLDDAGRFTAPFDHCPFDAKGTKPWHRVHAVLELPDNFKNARFSIDGFGIQGILKVNQLQVEIVRLRSWAQVAGVILVAGWVLFLAYTILPFLTGPWLFIRCIVLSAAFCTTFGTFVFPQPRSLVRPLGLNFWLGPAIPRAPAVVQPAADLPLHTLQEASDGGDVGPQEQLSRRPRIRTLSPLSPEQTATPTLQVTPVAPLIVDQSLPLSRTSFVEKCITSICNFLRALDAKWKIRSYNLTHFTSFFAIGIAALILANRYLTMLPLAVIAILSEVIPDLIHDIGDHGDFYDGIANLCGLFAACLVFQFSKKFYCLWRRKCHKPIRNVL